MTAILMVAIMSIGIVSCGDDEQKVIIQPPVTDGFEGYWLQNTEGPCKFFYLDGEGGGTTYSSSLYSIGQLSTKYMTSMFYDENFPDVYGTVKDNNGKVYTLYYNSQRNPKDKHSLPLTYIRTGSSIRILQNGDAEDSFVVNVADGTISGYIKVTKVY